MITTEDVLSLNFYKKEKFTGSYRGMRYLLEKSKDEEDADIFRCHIWPGPYNYASTPDEKKRPPASPSPKKEKSRRSTG